MPRKRRREAESPEPRGISSASGHLVVRRLAPAPRRFKLAEVLVRAGLILSALWIVFGLTVTWLSGVLVQHCQDQIERGLDASRRLEASLERGKIGAQSDTIGRAESVNEIRGVSEALEIRLGLLSPMLPRHASAAVADASVVSKDVLSSLPEGSGPLSTATPQRRLLDGVRELEISWTDVSVSLAAVKSTVQQMLFRTVFAACLLVLLLSLVIVLHSDSIVRSAVQCLKSVVGEVTNGEMFRSTSPAEQRELDQLPEQWASFSENLGLLARLVQGHCQVAVQVLDILSSAVAIMTGEFRILAASHSFCHILGCTPDSAQGKLLSEVFPESIPTLWSPGSSTGGESVTDRMMLLSWRGCRTTYRARLREVLPGSGSDGILFLVLSDVAEDESLAPREGQGSLYRRILESVSEAVLLVERDGSVIDVSPLAVELLGSSREELVGRNLNSLQEKIPQGPEASLNVYLSSPNWRLDGRVLRTRAARRDGSVFTAEFTFRELELGDRSGYLVKVRDISQAELADSLSRERLRVVELIARNQPVGVVLTRIAEMVEHQMPGSYCVVMLKRGDRLVPAGTQRLPEAFLNFLGDLSLDSFDARSATAYVEGRPILFDNLADSPNWDFLRAEAERRGIHSSLTAPVHSSEGLLVGFIAAFRTGIERPSREHADLLQLGSQLVSVCVEQRELNSKLAYRAQHDALTGLLNRSSFDERVRHAIAQAERGGRLLTVLSVDLDRFKLVNDTLGHAAGDELIKQVSARLVETLRETDIVARWGGDEFVVGLLEIGNPRDAKVVAEKLLDRLRVPYEIAGRLSNVSASIGISVYPADGRDLDALVRHADTAMYQAKQGGRNGFRCYDARLGETDQQRVELEAQLPLALERGELSLHYQPQFDLRNRSIVCAEALLRWRHPEHGLIPPSTFIPIAEESGAIVRIGEWVIREALREAKKVSLLRRGNFRVAVNVSRVQFLRPDFVDLVVAAIKEAGIESNSLELELTESMLMEPRDESTTRMSELRALGVKITIDDFGTGYSCLSYLQRLPIDHLKIDQSFVQELDQSSRTRFLVKSIVGLSASLGVVAIAEGVELTSQLEALKTAGCHLAQGNLLSEPLPSEEFRRLVRRHGANGLGRLRRHALGGGSAVPAPVLVHDAVPTEEVSAA